MSASNDKKSILKVHDTTLPHLDLIEKAILETLVAQGRAVIVSEESA